MGTAARRTTPAVSSAARELAASGRAGNLDQRLVSAADNTADGLRPVASDWPVDYFASVVYAEALVRLKSTLPCDAFENLHQQYQADRATYHARLAPPVDCPEI